MLMRPSIEWLALTVDEIIEVVLGQQLIQPRVERMASSGREVRRRHPHLWLPLAFAFSHGHALSLIHEIDRVDPLHAKPEVSCQSRSRSRPL